MRHQKIGRRAQMRNPIEHKKKGTMKGKPPIIIMDENLSPYVILVFVPE
jgi:hypothetical protein